MVYRFGDCTLDTQRHRLQRTGQPIRLRSKAFQVLLYLLEHRDRTVLKSELYEQVWPQQFISEATLESTLRAVRQAIGDSGRAQQLIQTVYGYGYRVIAAVKVCADLPPGAAGEALRPLPGSASAPPSDDDLHTAPLPCTPEAAWGDDGGFVAGLRDAGELTPQELATDLAPERPAVPSRVWEQKLVAVLAVEFTFPTATVGEAAAYEPWRAASRWEQALVAKVQEFGGVVLQRSPSLLLAAFGVPRTLEQLPQRAVQAALALRHLVVKGTEREPCPELRFAVHWGPLLVDVETSDPTAQLRAIGDTLASPVRLLGQATPGDILLSPELGPLVEGWCEVQVREVPLQIGAPGRIKVYAVVGHRPPWAWLGLHGRRSLSRFVGRDREFALLRELLPQVEGGRGQVMGMIGEPGVSKSRLCYEFIRGALAPPWRLLETQGTAYGRATPYLPGIDLLKDYFRLDDRDALPTVCEKVTTTLRGLNGALTPTVPAFLALLDVPVDDPQWQALAAPQRRQRTLDAIKRLLLWESSRQPLLLVIENLHWIDTGTQAVLDTLINSLPAARLFLLTTYRPEYQHGWGNKTYYTQLRLDPLAHESAQALLDSLLGIDAAPEPLKRRLIERAQGNPFFLEESVRTLMETQALDGAQGAFHLAKALQSIQVPSTVQAVLAARIDRLPPEEKHLLQTAAVIGPEVPLPLLQRLAGLPEDVLHRGLAQLQGGEFLYGTHLFPAQTYTFKHALTREVAYGSLLHERWRALHRQIVEALEALYPDRLGEYAERLAQHALQGEVWEKAVRYCQEAGLKAQYRDAFREAMTGFAQALDALDHLPDHPDTGVLGIELRRRLGANLSMVGEHQRSLAVLGQAEAWARRLNDRTRLGQVLSRVARVRTIVGDFDGAMAAGGEALGLAVTLGDPAQQVQASYRVGQVYVSLGDYRRAAAMLRGNMAALARSAPGYMRDWCIKSQAWLAEVLSMVGEFLEGRRYGEEALRLTTGDASWTGDVPTSVRAHLGALYLAQGDLEAAVRVLGEALALCRTSGDQAELGPIAGDLGEAYAHTGRVAEGLALLEEARRGDLRTGAFGGGYVTHLRQLSVVYLLAGRLDEARQHACQALDLARQQKARGYEAMALHQLGVVHAHTDPPDVVQAETHYQQALTLADELGMRPLQAHCHRGLGTLYAKIAWPEQARAELATTIELFRSMDMTFWLPQTEAALAQIGG